MKLAAWYEGDAVFYRVSSMESSFVDHCQKASSAEVREAKFLHRTNSQPYAGGGCCLEHPGLHSPPRLFADAMEEGPR